MTQGTAETIAFAQSLGLEPGVGPRGAGGRRARPALLPHEVQAHARRGLPRLVRARARGQGRAPGGRGGRAPRRRPAGRARRSPSASTQATEAGHGDEDMAATYRLSKPS